MNSKRPKYPRIFSALFLILLHLVVILLGGYFLSPEFTLYPYLVSRGFLPYINIIDQHFPSLIFGPFSFPSWLTANPFPLLLVFCTLTVLTDLFVFLSLTRWGNKKPLSWLLAWIVVSYWFSGNTLQLDSFVTLYLALIFFLGRNNRPFVGLTLGFLFAMVLLVKPTLLPLLVLLFIFQKITPDRYFFTGFFLPLLITTLYLAKLGIIPDFLNLTITFNREYYLQLATKIPSLRQALETSVIFLVPTYFLLKRRKYFSVLIILLALTPVFPRFEYIHLQPALLLLLFLTTRELGPAISFLTPICLVLLTFFVYRNLRHDLGNFYLDEETIKVAAVLKARPGNFLYIMSGNELLYPLTNRVPPWSTYLPPLPWYWKDESLAKKVIIALAYSPETMVLIKKNATIDGVNIEKNTGIIGKFLERNYEQVETIGSYRVYQRILK